MNNRYKNPYFWIGLGGVILTAMGLNISEITNWQSLQTAFVDFISNPSIIATTFLAILGVFVDPTTKGIKDIKNNENKNDK